MLARIWHGRTRAGQADAYARFLVERAIPDYRRIPGNLGAYILRRPQGAETHFLTLTLWESEAAIRTFAGPDIEQAKYYPEDAGFLLEFEPHVAHYEVVDYASAVQTG